MTASLDALLSGLIDYAGLFPPAGLSMSAAVGRYADYRGGERRNWLGRFVVPVSRLDEFTRAAADLPRDLVLASEPWRLSALAGADLHADLAGITEFGAAHARGENPVFRIDSIEAKAGRVEEILEAMVWIPDGIACYFEIPIRENPAGLIAAISRTGARAKVRTGGVTEDAIPAAADLARFLVECARADAAFKATAGLHHPLRSRHPLTYEPGAPEGLMFGFLNVFLAAAFARKGMGAEDLSHLLEEEAPGSIAFDDQGATWGGRHLDLAQLREARRSFAIAFGSCSFEEPVNDLRALGLE